MMCSGRSAARGMPVSQDILACPQCRQVLGRSEDYYQCSSCSSRFPIVAGIPDFAPGTEIYWGELSPDEMKEAVAQAERGGYEAGANFAASCCPGLRDYLMDQRRIDWLFHCLSPRENDACLDIGSGWGTLSRALTQFYRTVWSLEIMRERLEFQAAFKKHEGLEGLKLMRGSAIALPFPDRTFNLVVANGIIQWIGLADPTRPVEELQLQFLRECRRVLRPGGTLFLGCENRYGLFNWLGAKDHSGLPYTSLMPRWMADRVVRRYRKREGKFVRSFRAQDDWADYRTHTHSVQGYERLLLKAGFGGIRGYWAHPSNNEPQYMGRLDDARSIRDLLQFAARNLDLRVEGSFLAQLLVRLRFLARFSILVKLPLRLLAPELVFFAGAGKGVSDESTVESLVGGYTLRYGGSNKVLWWGSGNGKQARIVKMARFPKDRPQVAHEEEMLRRHCGLDIGRKTEEGWVLFSEPFLDARPVDCLRTDHNRDALAWLRTFHNKSTQGEWKPAAFQKEVHSWLGRYCEVSQDEELRQSAREYCDELLRAASGIEIPIVAEHGDFWWRNILRAEDGRLYVIDWQHTRPVGDPLFDFAMLSYTYWETWCKANGKISLPGTDSPGPGWMLNLFCEQFYLPAELVYAYYPYALIRRAVRSASLPRHGLQKALRECQFPRG